MTSIPLTNALTPSFFSVTPRNWNGLKPKSQLLGQGPGLWQTLNSLVISAMPSRGPPRKRRVRMSLQNAPLLQAAQKQRETTERFLQHPSVVEEPLAAKKNHLLPAEGAVEGSPQQDLDSPINHGALERS